MSSFSIIKKEINGEDYILINGVIDEEAEFIDFDKTTDNLTLDLESVEYINSCGIREWINWIDKNCKDYKKILILNCPHHIIEVANVVTSFFKPNFSVESFYIPYYIDEADEVFYKLFKKNEDYPNGKLELPEEIDTSQGKAELDIIPAKFLKFMDEFI